jgi:cyclopropane fatty-acyl-phospholipid synthase-like methyltransferase
MAAGFDRVARAYRWMEYLSFGPMLERCRFYRLPQVLDREHGLVIGDGDGRFLARLMRQNTQLRADAVDASAEMLRLLEERVSAEGARARLTLHCEDARGFSPSGTYDLVATHFFLDCLSSEEVAELAGRIRPYLRPDAIWIVSDFAIPEGLFSLPSRLMVSFLYAAFGILTGLKARSLPRHGEALRAAGLSLTDRKTWLGGLIFSEVWTLEATAGTDIVSH